MSAPYTVSKVLRDERIRHGFFGREGGRSKGDFAGNNMSISQGDNPDLVVSNRSSAAFALGGYGIKDLVVFRQVHSTTVITLTERHDPAVAIEADAMVTNRGDIMHAKGSEREDEGHGKSGRGKVKLREEAQGIEEDSP